MIDDKQLLDSITETADMACSSIEHVMQRTGDAELNAVLQSQFDEYRKDFRAASDMLKSFELEPKRINPAPKFYANMVADMKTMAADNVPSKIAEMVIQGSTMGITELTKQLHAYGGVNEAIRKLAQKHVRTEQANIEQMKRFL